MAEITDKTVADRRNFLKLAGLTATGGAIAAVTGGKEVQASTEMDADQSGYRETDHVRKYYKLAEF